MTIPMSLPMGVPMNMTGPRVRLVSLLSLGVLACGGDDETRLPNGPGGALALAPEPTFWQHVAPILNEKCTSCHQTRGIAPFPLDNFEDAEQRANLIADYTENRIMPPYLMEVGGECGSFDESDALSEEQIATIGAWARGERRRGTPAVMTPPEPQSIASGLDVSTPEFAPRIEGGPLAEFDEYRCFGIDLGLTEDAFITGFEFEPGNTALVHHVVSMLVDRSAPSNIAGMNNADAIARLRGMEADPSREGWHCYAEAGDGVRVESAPAVWAPGALPYRFREGVGVRVRPAHELIVQVHYNLARAEVRGQTDRTRLRLQMADRVERQAVFMLPDAFLETLRNPEPDALPPGNPAAAYGWTRTGAELGIPEGVPVEVLAVSPHMHERGRKFSVEFGRDGAFECQGRVNRWDFNWQRGYDYLTPPVLDAASQVRVGCEYDTSADSSPVLPGWGTRNEMCLLILAVAFPPGVSF